MTTPEIIKQIKKITEDQLCSEEISEYLDTLQDNFDDLESDVHDKNKEIDDLEEKVDELKSAQFEGEETHIIGGLDTVRISFESGNFEVKERVNNFFERLKKHYNATTT